VGIDKNTIQYNSWWWW